jgi:hypothetical protein
LHLNLYRYQQDSMHHPVPVISIHSSMNQ